MAKDRPEIDIDLSGDGDDKDSITRKSKFWKWLNKEKQKIVIIASIVGSAGVICTYCGPLVSDALSMGSKNKKTIDTLKLSASKHDERILILEKKLDSMKLNEQVYRYHIVILNDILYAYMQSVIVDGVRFKKAANGKLYYNINGILYPASQDANSGQYYYEDYNEKVYWCQ